MKEFNLTLTQVELAAAVAAINAEIINGVSERKYSDGQVNYVELADKFRKAFHDQK